MGKKETPMAKNDRTFDPSTAQTGRGRTSEPAPGQRAENPEEDWGEPADEGAAYSANHAMRGRKTDAERGPGRKTRQATKDAISRRAQG
jgi:hypothetical protein